MIPSGFDERGRAAAAVTETVAAESVGRVTTLFLSEGRLVWADRPLDEVVPGMSAGASGVTNPAEEINDADDPASVDDADSTAGDESPDFYDRLGAVAATRTAADLRPGPATNGAESPNQDDPPAEDGQRFRIETGDQTRYYRLDSAALTEQSNYDRVACLREVTETVERHADLLTFERLADRAQDGLYATDGDGRIRYCNDSFGALVGADPASLRGREAASLVVEGERERCRRALDQHESGDEQTALELTHLTTDGDAVPLSVTLTARSTGGVVAVARDVTERNRRERRLEQYRTLVESAGDPMWVLDADGRVELCNESMVELFGVSRADLVGSTVGSILPDADATSFEQALDTLCDDVYDHPGTAGGQSPSGNYRSWDAAGQEASASVLGSGDSQGGNPNSDDPRHGSEHEHWQEVNCTLEDDDGETREFEVTLGPIVDAGEVVGSVGTFRDVTERERRTAELELLQRVLGAAVRTEVAAGTREICDRADRLADRRTGTEAALAETIRERCESLASLAAKGAVVDRLVETDPRPVGQDLAPLVERSVDDARERNPDGSVSVDLPDVQVRAIPALTLAVRNLVENALEHAGPAPDVEITATVTDGTVSLHIADDGPGVLQAELETLERGAETALEHGSGVGLWLVDWVVEKSGGDLSFETAGGTCATVTLDRHRPVDSGTADDVQPDGAGNPSGQPTGDPGQGADAAGLLFVAGDDKAVADVREAAEVADAPVTVETVPTADAAVSRLADDGIDCVVTPNRPDDEWDRLQAAVEADDDLAILLYSSVSHTELAESRLTSVDSIVERGPGTEPARFLVRKALAITGATEDSLGPEEPERTEATAESVGGRALIGVRTGGETRWPSGSVTDLLAEPDAAGKAASESLQDELDGTDPGDGRLITVDTASGRRYYLHTVSGAEAIGSDSGEGDGPTEIGQPTVESLCDLTPVVDRGEQLALARTLVERAQDGISVVDADGRIAYHNDSFADILGHDDMVGEHSATYMADGQLERGQLAIQRLLATPELDSEVLDMDFVTAAGDQVTLAVHYTVREDDGEYAGLINVARDVTERKRRERRLEQYRTLVESAGDPMFTVDEDGRIRLVNAALVRLFGRSREELRGQPVADLLRPETFDRGLEAARALVDGEHHAGTAEVWFRDTEGARHRYEVTVRDCGDGVEPEDGGFTGSVWTCRDVTERERRADELDLLKQVLGRVLRHNLRNELTLVKGHAELLADHTDGETRALAREIIERTDVLTATARSARAVEGVLEHHRDDCVHVVADVVETTVERLDDSVSVEYDVSPDLRVEGARTLPSALESLLVTLGAYADEPDSPIRLSAEREGERVQIRATLPPNGRESAQLASFDDDPDTILDRDGDVSAWLVAWVVDASGGDVRVPADEGPRVVITLPATDAE